MQRTSLHRSPCGERRIKRKRSMICLERTRKGHAYPLSDEHWNCLLFKRQRWGKFRATGWSSYGLFRAHRYHPKLNLTVIRHCPVGSIPQAARLVSHLTNTGPLLPNIDIGNYGRNRSATLQPHFFLPLPPSFCHRDIRSESW